MQAIPRSNDVKHQVLKTLDESIADRKRYIREQEALIADLVEAGNTQLMYLQHDILLAKQELREIKTDIRTATRDKVLLSQDLSVMREEIQLTVVDTGLIQVTTVFGS